VTQRQNNNAGLTENFYYDSLYRLDHSSLVGTTNLQMTYDAMGNITARSDVAGGAPWTYDATRRHAVLQAGNANYTYTYDANGNAATRNGYAIVWSSYNYPTSINGNNKNIALFYGPNRQRYKQIYSSDSVTETTFSVGGLMEKVIVGGISDYRHYIRAGNELIAIVSRQSSGTNAIHYILSDHQGSLDRLTDASGALTIGESFNAFGTRRDPNTWSGTPTCPDLCTIKGITREGYTGQDAIGGVSMGLNHMNGRVQDAITGRFLSPDPHIPDPMNTQSFNRYSYVNNNPLTFIDPSGFDGCYDTNDGIACEGDAPAEPSPPDAPPSGPGAGPGSGPAPGAGGQPAPAPAKTNPAPALPEITVTAQRPCMKPQAPRSTSDEVTDAIVGFGDAFLIPILVRDLTGIGNGTVDTNSSAYNGGEISGTIEGLIPLALEGAAAYSAAQSARGTPSILNANPFFRIGPGRWGGNMVPRISSPYLPGDGHINLSTRLPPIPPLGALASNSGC
jgi:RHS repeat-associated protein